MAYFEYPMGWEQGAKQSGESLLSYTHRVCKNSLIHKQHGQSSHASAEYFWHEDGKPYYKVDDAAVEMFRKISIDVPFKYVVAPFKQFLVRFSDTNPIRTSMGPIRSVLVMSITSDEAKEELGTNGAMAFKSNSVVKEGFFALFVDIGEKINGIPYMNYIIMHRCPEIPVQQSLDLLPVKQENEIHAAGLQKDLLSIVVSVCFLATSSDKIIKPDVLSKDLAVYLEAERKQDTARIKVLSERAIRRGKIGYLVDGKRELVHSHHEHHDGEPTGRELKYKHVRSAHFRRLESGVVTFVRQTVIRKDLPARPS
jgi:hypothetical protein